MKITLAALTLALTVAACENPPTTGEQHSMPQSMKIAPTIRSDDLDLSDFNMRKSATIPVSGDLRPMYLVAGRVQNKSPYPLTGLRFVIQLTQRGVKRDSAVVALKLNVPAGEAQTFAQNIHLLPPPGKWDWSYYVEEIETESGLTVDCASKNLTFEDWQRCEDAGAYKTNDHR